MCLHLVLRLLRFVLDHLTGVLQVLAGPLDGLTGDKAQQGKESDDFGHVSYPSLMSPLQPARPRLVPGALVPKVDVRRYDRAYAWDAYGMHTE